MDYLRLAEATARPAGDLLRAEFLRPGGPRGDGGHAEVDSVAEWLIRERLLAATPGWGYLGEETGFVPRSAGEPHLWSVDPNDGTRSYLRGERGSAVSIALLRDGLPVLGVVYAFAAPDNAGDLLAWAEGCGPLRRNGRPVERPSWATTLDDATIVIISQAADIAPAANLATVAPGRYRPEPSIAYRLALVAAGEAEVAVTVNVPVGWDVAGGHALLRAVGGTLVEADGTPTRHTADGDRPGGYCFGGAPALVAEVARRYRGGVPAREVSPREPYAPVRATRGAALADDGVLHRAQGCLLGQLTGDALGSLVEFKSAAEIARLYADGPRTIGPSPVWGTLAGQPTDDSELALLLARVLLMEDGFDAETVAAAYVFWHESTPFDEGATTAQALSALTQARHAGQSLVAAAAAGANQASQANGALMRQSPLAIWGHTLPADELATALDADTRLTHPNRVCRDASAAFGVALAAVVREGHDARAAYQTAVAWDAAHGASPSVTAALAAAARAMPDFGPSSGHVIIALQNAFYQALHAPSFEEGVVATVRGGGDTDTNAAIAGALLGTLHGVAAIPWAWRSAVLTCRPHASRARGRLARPMAVWPIDALILAERLAWQGARRATHPAPSR
ncbi:MAG: ADP-ribosylglycohydrolase family protein [Chloroflexi bacterium]|nr:ADP-ribosylglycohydrolase family protein [Chloroflexota bacterium]